jgi:DNA polymerase-3 subunit gamma/tau
VSYQVFARKYRPRTFDDVLGQEHVVRTLRNAISQNRLAHAYLFVGPRGTGKTSTARIFAKALNCPGGPMVNFDPDDELCREIEKGICLDVREIDGASNNGVEQVRELREEVKFAPSRCRFKIYYIDEVHMLSTAAFNALLKTLEEPPEHVKFIFATTEAHKVLPTIISRCQRFDLRRIPTSLIAKHLLHIATQESVKLSEKAAYAIAKGAEGGMRDAQSMLDQLVAFCGESIAEQDVLDIFGFTQGETVASLALRVLERDTVGALQELHAQAEGGKDLARLLVDLIQHLRTVLVHQVDPAAAEEDLSPEVAAMTRAQAAMVDAERLLRVMDELAEVDSRMRWAGNKLLHLELGLIQAVQTLGEVTLSDVIVAMNDGSGGANLAIAPKRAVVPVSVPPAATIRAASPVSTTPAPVPAPVRPAPVETSAAVPVQRVVEAPVVSTPHVPTSTPVERPAPVAEAPPVPAPAPAPEPAPPQASVPETLEDAWKHILEQVHQDYPLYEEWLIHGALLELTAQTAKVGLPTTESMARESLLRPSSRAKVEECLAKVLQRPVKLEVVLDPSLKPPPATEMTFGFGFGDPTPPPAKAAPAAAAPAPEAPKAPEGVVSDPEFYNDPLIQAAIVKFKATLVK